MKSSDYIVDFLIEKGIKHIFGYQGTMIAHLVDSICKDDRIENHCCYNEQGAGFAAVGYAKATGQLAAAYSTSGPGAANLMSAIADAFYDSAPVIFFTGQLNTYEYFDIEGLRQNGFQEMDVVSMAGAVTKYCVKLERIEDLRFCLEKACHEAISGRPGPVVIDLPMDLQRQDINPENMKGFTPEATDTDCPNNMQIASDIIDELNRANAPVLLLGNGIVNGSDANKSIITLAEKLSIPIITSMLGRDLIKFDHPLNFGHIGGGYGHRYSNMIANKKADLIIALGCSVCKRQTGVKTEKFATGANIIRVDIDHTELSRKVHDDEKSYCADCNMVIDRLHEIVSDEDKKHDEWLQKCDYIREKLAEFDDASHEREPNLWIKAISEELEEGTVVCCDVGQHQVWTSQSYRIKDGQQLLFSGGHGAMGFALPAGIGAYYASGHRSAVIAGDGAMQMNIQELQWVFREQIPMSIFVINNNSLGLIRQQQDDMLNSFYAGSLREGGFTSPDFCKVATAYGIDAFKISKPEEIRTAIKASDKNKPVLFECLFDINFGAYPKTYFGEEMHNQRPYIPSELMNELMEL